MGRKTGERGIDRRIGRWSEAKVLKHLPGARKGKRREGKGDVRRGATEKGGCVRVIEGEEVRGDDPVEYFLPAEIESDS